jgi:hypothetical protein
MNGSAVASSSFNLIGTGGGLTNGVNNNQVGINNPQLGPLKNNGGTTLTRAPLTNSPAIDRGKDLSLTGLDQRGLTRPVTYNDPSIVPPVGGDRSDIGAVELAPGVIPLSASSRKLHAGNPFFINLPLSGPVGVECRSGGVNGDYTVIITFASAVTLDNAVVNDGVGSVSSASGNGTTQVSVNITGVANAQRLTIALFGVNNGTNSGDVGVPLAVLIGDTGGNGSVNSADIGQTKSQSGNAVSGTNFREDVTVDGNINSSDIGLVKSKSGTALP